MRRLRGQHRWTLALLAATAIGIAAGCGSSSDATAEGPTTTEGQTTTEGPTTTEAEPTSTAPTTSVQSLAPTESPVDPEVACADAELDSGSGPTATPPPDEVVVLLARDGARLCLGPVLVAGEIIESAIAKPVPGIGWGIDLVFTVDGIDRFNAAAGRCAPSTNDPSVCPTMRLALVDGDRVVTSPTVQAASFERDQVVISGDYDEAEAKLLADRFQGGGLVIRPVLLDLGP